jgi:hypothetical protein
MKTYGGVEVWLHHSWLRHSMEASGQLHASAALPSGERYPGTHWTGGWVGPTAGLDTVEWREISYPCRESNPSRPPRSPSLHGLSYSGSSNVWRSYVKDDSCYEIVKKITISTPKPLYQYYNLQQNWSILAKRLQRRGGNPCRGKTYLLQHNKKLYY